MENTTWELTDKQRESQRQLVRDMRKLLRRHIGEYPGVWHSETINELHSLTNVIDQLEQKGQRPQIIAAWQPPLRKERKSERTK